MDFIIDDNRTLSYGELLDCANGESECPTQVCAAELADFAKIFFISAAKSRDIELYEGRAETRPGEAPAIRRSFNCIDDFFGAVKASASKIYLHTSGTTGRAKRICHTIETLARNIRTGEKHSRDVWGFCYAPTHMAGLQVLLQAALNKNACVNLFGKPRQQTYSEISERSITHMSATPTFYRLLLPFERELPKVVRATFGGEKSSPSLYAAVSKIFPNAKITNIYASTEAGALLASDADIFKIPPEMKEFVRVDNGELLIHESLLPHSGGIPISDGFYRTGDMVEFADAEGASFRFVGRTGSFINVGGYKVNPEEVEEAIKNLDGVSNARVFGRKNSVLGNILCADIKLLQNASLSESDVRAALSKTMRQFNIPRVINFVDSIILTGTGKVKRQ